MRSPLPVLALLCMLATPATAAAPADDLPVVHAVPVAPEVTWDGPQFAGADAKGRVFLLHAETLAVYPVRDTTRLGTPRRLESTGLGNPTPPIAAAMGPHGDWVTYNGTIRWFRSGKEEAVPAPRWHPRTVALLDGRPVVMVLPFRAGRWTEDEHVGRPPLVLAFDGDGWSRLVDSELEEVPQEAAASREELACLPHAAADGTLWLGDLYRYRLRQFSAAGRELVSVAVDGAQLERRGADDPAVREAREMLEAEAAKLSDDIGGARRPARVTIVTNTLVERLRGLCEGRDGKLYVLLRRAGAGLVLDRFDPVTGLLERVATDVENYGAVSMVAGKDGLYVVNYSGSAPRWLLPWNELDAADWQPVEDVEVNGNPLAPPAPDDAG